MDKTLEMVIDYFSVVLVLFMAKTTALIRVYLRFMNLKKQSQFAGLWPEIQISKL